jgi:hypothetical protein
MLRSTDRQYGERSCCRPGFFMRGTGERSCCRPGFFMRGTGERSCCLLLLIDTFFIATLFYLTIKIIHRKTFSISKLFSCKNILLKRNDPLY